MEPGKPRSKGSDGAVALVTKLLGKNNDASTESSRLVKASRLLAVSLTLDGANSRNSQQLVVDGGNKSSVQHLLGTVTQRNQIEQVVKSAAAVNGIIDSQARAIAKLSKAVERLERRQRQLGAVGGSGVGSSPFSTGGEPRRPGTASALFSPANREGSGASPSLGRSRSATIFRETGLQLPGTPGTPGRPGTPGTPGRPGSEALSPGMEFETMLTPNGRPVTPNAGLPPPKNGGGGLPTATTWSNPDFISSKVHWPADDPPEHSKREPAEYVKTLAGGGSGHINSRTAVMMARARQGKATAPVAVYEGGLATGPKANPVVSKWCNEFGNEQRDFDSVALFAETRLLEAIEQTEQLGVPNRVLALKCCEVIEESAVVYGRFSTFLRLALHHLIPCIFSGLDHAPPLDVHSARMCESFPTYFEVTMEQAKEIRESKQEMAEQQTGLWGSAKARSKIFAFIFKNVFRTVLRLLFRGWKQIIAQKVGRIIGFQKRSYYRWFFVWRTVMRQRRALSLQAAILNKKNEELMFEEKEEPEEEQEKQVVIKEVIVEKKVETATVEVQTDRVVISEYVEPPKITVSTIQKLKSRGKKAKQVEEKEEEVLPLHKGMELVTLVYEEKLQQDIRDEGKHIEPQDLKQFCRDVLIRKYGIQSLAKKNMRALLASTREGAGRSNKRLQLFSELLALKPKDLPPDTPAPQYMPEMVDIFAKLLRNLWGGDKKGTLTSCFQAVTPTVNCVMLCKAVKKSFAVEQSKDPDGVRQLLEHIEELPKTTITTAKTESVEVNVDDSFLMIMTYWREKFQSLKAATAKGLWNSMLILARGVRNCSKRLRTRKAQFKSVHERKYKIWEAVVQQKMSEQSSSSSAAAAAAEAAGVAGAKDAEEAAPAGGEGGVSFTYADFKSMIDDAFPNEVNDREIMEYFMEWEDRTESMVDQRLEEHEEKFVEARRVFEEEKRKTDESFAKALADAEEKKKLAILEEETAKANEDAAKVLAEGVENPFGNVAKPATQCECGNVFMGDSKFCRKCGKPRPHAELLDDPKAGDALETQCKTCGNIFMGDSVFCRKCGTVRPEKKSPTKEDAEGGAAAEGASGAAGGGGGAAAAAAAGEGGSGGGAAAAATKDKTRVVLFTSSGRPIRPADPVLKVKPLDEAGKRELSQRARLDAYLAVSWERHMRRERNAQRRDKLIAQAQSGVLGKMMMNTALGGGGSVAGSTGSGGYNGGRQRQQQAGDGGRSFDESSLDGLGALRGPSPSPSRGTASPSPAGSLSHLTEDYQARRASVWMDD